MGTLHGPHSVPQDAIYIPKSPDSQAPKLATLILAKTSPLPKGGGGWGTPNFIHLVFPIKRKMEPQMEIQGSPPSPNSICKEVGMPKLFLLATLRHSDSRCPALFWRSLQPLYRYIYIYVYEIFKPINPSLPNQRVAQKQTNLCSPLKMVQPKKAPEAQKLKQNKNPETHDYLQNKAGRIRESPETHRRNQPPTPNPLARRSLAFRAAPRGSGAHATLSSAM